MTDHHRNFIAGSSFFSVNLAERPQRFLMEHIDILRIALTSSIRHLPEDWAGTVAGHDPALGERAPEPRAR